MVGNAAPVVLDALTDLLNVTGALAADSTIQVPNTAGHVFACTNNTTGAHVVSLKGPFGATIVGPAQGKAAMFAIQTDHSLVRISPDT